MKLLIMAALVVAVVVIVALDEERETRRRYHRVRHAERRLGVESMGEALEGLTHDTLDGNGSRTLQA